MSDAAARGGRYAAPDVMRGIALISMLIYHAAWDMVYLRGADWPWYGETPGFVWQQSILWSFVLLSGFCQALGRRQYRRGALVFFSGALVSAVTLAATPENRIIFGVLTFLGAAMLLFTLLSPVMNKCPPAVGLGACAVLFAVTREAPSGFFGFGALHICALPARLYRSYFTAFFGFPQRGFFSADYVPLVPWIFLFGLGFFLCRLLREKERLNILLRPRLPAAEWLGRHSLEIYLIHQPLLYFFMTYVF